MHFSVIVGFVGNLDYEQYKRAEQVAINNSGESLGNPDELTVKEIKKLRNELLNKVIREFRKEYKGKEEEVYFEVRLIG